MNKTKILIILSFLFSFLLIFILQDKSKIYKADIKNSEFNVLNIKKIDNKIYKLNGNYKFYWNKMSDTEDISKEDLAYIKVPLRWKQYNNHINGYGTYRIKVNIEESIKGENYAIYFGKIGTAYKLGNGK